MNSDFATIEEAFGIQKFQSPDPPSLRGDVARVHDQRHKRMDQSIANAHTQAIATPGAPSCFGNANPRELERCSAGTTHPVCPACARRHTCLKHATPESSIFSGINDMRSVWRTLSRDQKVDLLWLMIQDILTSDAMLVVLFGIIAYLVLRRT